MIIIDEIYSNLACLPMLLISQCNTTVALKLLVPIYTPGWREAL